MIIIHTHMSYSAPQPCLLRPPIPLLAMAAVRTAALILIVIAVSHSLPSALAKPVQYCDRQGNYNVKVHGVDILPDPVISGKPATFSISATTGEAIDGGKLVIEVYFWGVHIHSETHDLCEETTCPISAGDFVISHSQSLPGYTPPGSYTLKMKMLGSDGSQLSCISFGFKIKFGAFVADT